MKQIFAVSLVALVLAGCTTTPATRSTGVGFNDYQDYESQRLAREAELRGQRVRGPQTVLPLPAPGSPAGGAAIPSSDLAAAGIGVSGGADRDALGAGRGRSTVQGDVAIASTGISDEQDFGAVSNRETIESDADRLARQAAAYRVIQPTAVPERRGSAGPNIVEFAVSTSHAKGQAVYSRSALSGERKQQRACAEYLSADQAQRAFLAAGGPERDRLGVDPDGDGFACAWDPAPYRRAVSN